MTRRKLTLRRIDPWSVLKFGFALNLALMMVGLLGAWLLWLVIGRLDVIATACDSIGTVFLNIEDCGVNGGALFRTLFLVGLLGVVVQTGIMVLMAFLYNLIADLTGGLQFTFIDEAGNGGLLTTPSKDALSSTNGPVGRPPVAPVSRGESRPERGEATSGASSAGTSGSGSSVPRREGDAAPRRETPTTPSQPSQPSRPTSGGQDATRPTPPSTDRPTSPGSARTEGGSLWDKGPGQG